MRCIFVASLFAIASLTSVLAGDGTSNALVRYMLPSLPPSVLSSGLEANVSALNGTTNSTTNSTKSSPPPPPSSPVSWQSALWGLIALSLNAQTQRSAADHFPSSDSLSPARSSPFICLADMLVAVLWLLGGRKAGLGIGGSLAWCRREMGLLREKGDRELIQGVPAVTISFFVLGPFPQALKLFCATGLPWTKLWAVIFSLAWLVEVVLRFIAGMKYEVARDNRDLDLKQLARSLRWSSKLIYQAAFIVQVAVWLWILIKLAATTLFCDILGIMLLGISWILGMGTVCWILALSIPLYLTIMLKDIPIKIRVVAMLASYAGICYIWLKHVWGADWFYNALTWFLRISTPVGFIVALLLVPLCAMLFVWLCTAILIAFDALLVAFGQDMQDRELGAVESHSLLPREESEATATASDVGTSTADLNMSSMNAIQSLAENTPLPPSRATTGFNLPETWWLSVTALSDRLETESFKWTFHYSNLSNTERRRVQAIAFSLSNLFFTSMWYWCKYDPSGTQKAAWTDMFG